jgi:hypothetical protein
VERAALDGLVRARALAYAAAAVAPRPGGAPVAAP